MEEIFLKILSLIFLAIVSAYVYLIWNFNHFRKRGISGPKPVPIFGNLIGASKSQNVAYDYDRIYRLYKGKERFVGMFAARNPEILLIDPLIIRDVLITNFKHFHDNDASQWADESVDPLFANNPFFSVGQLWKDRRTDVIPAMTNPKIKLLYPVMQAACNKLTAYLEVRTKCPPKEGFNARLLAFKFLVENACDYIFGIEVGAFKNEKCPVVESAVHLIDNTFFKYLFITSFAPFIRRFYKRALMPRQVQKFFCQLTQDAIKMRKNDQNDRPDFLKHILQVVEKKNFNETESAILAMSFFLNSTVTSSIPCTHALHLLARHPEIQDRLRRELWAESEEDGSITFENLVEHNYLEQVFNETIRMFPPLVSNSKICTEPYVFIDSKGKAIPIQKGDRLTIPSYSLHMDPEYFPNPEEFNPERFSPGNGGSKRYKDMGVFLPFGDGPRICLGMRFGAAQVKAAIAELVKNWRFSVNYTKTQNDMIIDGNSFLCEVRGGVWLDFQRVKNEAS